MAETLIKWRSKPYAISQFKSDLDIEFRNIYRKLGDLRESVEAIDTSGTTATTTPVGSFNIRGAAQAVAVGSNIVVFSSAMSTSTYALSLRVKYSDGRETEVIETSKSQTGFVIEVVDAGTLNYIAVENA